MYIIKMEASRVKTVLRDSQHLTAPYRILSKRPLINFKNLSNNSKNTCLLLGLFFLIF